MQSTENVNSTNAKSSAVVVSPNHSFFCTEYSIGFTFSVDFVEFVRMISLDRRAEARKILVFQ